MYILCIRSFTYFNVTHLVQLYKMFDPCIAMNIKKYYPHFGKDIEDNFILAIRFVKEYPQYSSSVDFLYTQIN